MATKRLRTTYAGGKPDNLYLFRVRINRVGYVHRLLRLALLTLTLP